MQSLWDEREAAAHVGPLAQRVYTSRLLGQERSLVLHGGGNTSVKMRETNLFGEEETILYVKGSGSNLATIEASGFTPVRLEPLVRLLQLTTVSDTQWQNALKGAVADASAPAPSVETPLHAVLPHTYVDHTHPDALLAVGSTPSGMERVRDMYGDQVVIVPYRRSGFPIAKACAHIFASQSGDQTIGMVLMHHGLFTFGKSAREAYERTIDLVSRAEEYLERHGAWHISLPSPTAPAQPTRHDLAHLRQEVSTVAGYPLLMATHTDPQAMAFVQHSDVAPLSQQGPATPDHVIRTKNRPLLGARNLPQFRTAYERYFAAHASRMGGELTMLDPAPRVILDPAFGMGATGRTAKDVAITTDIYRNTIEIILRATALEQYRALPEEDIFEMEYWAPEQAKLRQQEAPPVFAGEIALVTGAASGIGRACVEAFLSRGAAVVGLDLNPAITRMLERPDFLGLACDVTSEAALARALDATVQTFGGLDMLVLNAGIFPGGCRIEALSLAEWRKVMTVNLDANLVLMRDAYPLLKLAPRGGRVAVIGSKNVPAPGPGAAAYSASKAALNQLVRVAALEWGRDGIRINTLHPDAVFDTGLWTEEVLRARAEHYGLTVDEYKRKNVLRVELASRDVANLAAELCGPLFGKITGAQVPVDGGNERVI